MKSLTIAVPFLKGTPLLQKCLTSIIAQDSEDWNCVVLDNCSEENSSAIVRGLNHDRVSHFRHPNRVTMAENWNTAFRLADGQFLCIVHSDDEVSPTFARSVIEDFSRFPEASAIYSRVDLIDDQSRRTLRLSHFIKLVIQPGKLRGSHRLHQESALTRLGFGNWIYCPSLSFRLSEIDTLRFDVNLSFAPDLKLIGDLLLDDKIVVGVSERRYRYRVHNESTTTESTALGTRFREERAIYNVLSKESLAKGWKFASFSCQISLSLRLHMIWDLINKRLKYLRR